MHFCIAVPSHVGHKHTRRTLASPTGCHSNPRLPRHVRHVINFPPLHASHFMFLFFLCRITNARDTVVVVSPMLAMAAPTVSIDPAKPVKTARNAFGGRRVAMGARASRCPVFTHSRARATSPSKRRHLLRFARAPRRGGATHA